MLYTKKGDKGTTKLFDSPSGVRVSKSSSIFEALGSLDELNSMTGFVKVLAGKQGLTLGENQNSKKVSDILENIQNLLFTLQASLAGSDKKLKEGNVFFLEEIIAEVEKVLPPITTFLVPGGSELSAMLDVLRTVARRTERTFVKVIDEGVYENRINEIELQFLNRLSSVYYALARYANHHSGNIEKPPEYV